MKRHESCVDYNLQNYEKLEKRTLKSNGFALNFAARVTISVRKKDFVESNSLKDQLEGLQEKLDDTANTPRAERAAIDKLLTAEKSQQIVEQTCQLSARNVELETEIKEKEIITRALENSKGKIFF